MPYMNCPKCGNSANDSAAICQKCGFGIRFYVNEPNLTKRYGTLNEKVDEKNLKMRLFSEIKSPQKPRLSIGMIVYVVLSSWLWTYLALFAAYEPLVEEWIYIMFVFVGAPLIFYGYKYIRRRNDYKLSNKNFPAYRALEIQRHDKRIAQDIENQKNMGSDAVRCRHCHNPKIYKTGQQTTHNLSPLAKGKITRGVQFACSECGDSWWCYHPIQ